MTIEQNYDYYQGLNLKIIQTDFLEGRIAYLNEMSIAEKKESDKAFKTKLKDWNDNYYTRTYFDLVPDYNFEPINGKWNYTPRFIKPADPYNWSVNSKYPADYDFGENKCVKISEGNVKFYNEKYFIRTLNTKISDFPGLAVSNEGDERCLIPSGTYVDIISTTTHKRMVKNSNKFYFYIMCRIKVNSEYNNHMVSDKVRRGDYGYIWHTFQGKIDQKQITNITYAYKPGTTGPDTVQRAMMDYYNFEIPFPSKADPQLVMKFEASGKSYTDANCLNKIKNTHATLFEALAATAYAKNVKEIHTGFVDYGANVAHPDGRAFDIWRLKTADEKVHTYTRGYNSKTITWDQPEQPALIHEFEEAFKNYGKTQTDPGPTENVWGPWYLYTGSAPAEQNVLAKYPELINVRTKDKYIDDNLDKTLALGAMKKKMTELSNYYDDKGLLKEIEEKLTGVTLTNGDDYPKLKKHWEHRHHGHFSVK